ncbi:MAG: Fic family protein [Patescibacteria group bacterium]
MRNIGAIEASKEIIDHAPLLPYYEKEFRKDALIRSVHYGTHIEGNELNLNQAEKVIEGQDVAARDRDIQEVMNYRRVIDYIDESQIENSKLQIDEGFVRRLHKMTVEEILIDSQSGVYRKAQVVIKNSRTGEVSFRPPPFDQISEQVKALLGFVSSPDSKEVHPVLKSGIVHYELVRIHPFVDGNGRVARALSTLILYQEGYDIRRFFSLEEYFDSDSKEYYEALQSVPKNNEDLTAWLEYFSLGLSIELSKIKEKIEGISVDVHLKQKLGGKPLMLSDRQLKIIEYIQKTGYLQNQAFESLFPMVSEDTILNELKSLLQNKIIRKQGKTKASRYIMK